MAGRRTGGGGGGPWRDLLSAIATLVMACVLVVALVSSGGWRAVSLGEGWEARGDREARWPRGPDHPRAAAPADPALPGWAGLGLTHLLPDLTEMHDEHVVFGVEIKY